MITGSQLLLVVCVSNGSDGKQFGLIPTVPIDVRRGFLQSFRNTDGLVYRKGQELFVSNPFFSITHQPY